MTKVDLKLFVDDELCRSPQACRVTFGAALPSPVPNVILNTDTTDKYGRLILPVFKKDGRTWLHKSSVAAKYGRENLILGKYKKDSRVWLHKSSKKRKWLQERDENQAEIEINEQKLFTRDKPSCCENCTNCKRLKAYAEDLPRDGVGDGPTSSDELEEVKELLQKENLPSPRTRWKRIMTSHMNNQNQPPK